MQNSHASKNQQNGIGFGALMAFVHANKAHLVEYGVVDFQPEMKTDKLFFASMGSGQLLADPFLAFVNRILWNGKMPTLELGRLGVYWTLDHTIKYAAGGVGGRIRLATLRKIGDNWVAEQLSESDEMAQFISEFEGKISSSAEDLIAKAPIKPLPAPPELS